MSLPRVILAEPTQRFDLSAAERHGELTYLSSNSLNPFTTEGMIGIFTHRLREIGFNPETDIICLTGQSLTTAIMLAVVASMHPTFKMLMFHAGSSDYRMRVFQSQSERMST